jgi:NADPH-dependent curcumin reductase CurA
MTELINKRWVLNKRPVGMPEDECWKLVELPVPEIEEGNILIKTLYLSIDPYMRGRMNDAKSYADPIKLGEIMTGESVGTVIESKSDNFKVGDYVCAHRGWQSYIVAPGSDRQLFRADPDIVPLSTYLGTVENEETPFHVFGALDPVPEHRFFVVTEWFEEWEEATKELSNWIKEGKIKYRETVTEGLENAPQALRDVLTGKNFGKQVVKVAEQ